ncbi:Hypothetical predicted protein [Paramuricea clavata]|uniref:Uncharacterized protein n=1 Tax=Paramuricea clavata TaxID=317549 RepID=A0A7D9I8L4_PARCT|nr:Hypothetical predicted protein [Paramuricea clavata]
MLDQKIQMIAMTRGGQSLHSATKCDAEIQTYTSCLIPSGYTEGDSVPVVAVKVYGNDGRGITTYALLDQASEASFIHRSLAKKFNLKAEKVNLILESANRSASKLQSRETIITDKLDIQLKVAPRNEDVQDWKHLSDIHFPQVELEEILILIGADNPDAFVTEEVRPGGHQEPWGFKYTSGWALLGPTSIESNNNVAVHLLQNSKNYNCEELGLQKQLNHSVLPRRWFERYN